MAVPAGKTRLNITLPDDVVALIDEEVERTGGTRSSVLAQAVLEAADMREMQGVTPQQMLHIIQKVIEDGS